MFGKKSKKIKELEHERDSLMIELNDIRTANNRIKCVGERQLVKVQSSGIFSKYEAPYTAEGITYMGKMVTDGLFQKLRDNVEIETSNYAGIETTVTASIWVAEKGEQNG